MIKIKVNEEEFKELALQEIAKYLRKMETETIFWDTKELLKQTRLSWNTIQDTFFYDQRFPKYKVGRKWMIPVQKFRFNLV